MSWISDPWYFKIKVLNSGVIAHNMSELIRESIPYL